MMLNDESINYIHSPCLLLSNTDHISQKHPILSKPHTISNETTHHHTTQPCIESNQVHIYSAKGFSISFIPSKGEIRMMAVPRSTDKPNCLVFSVMYPVSKSTGIQWITRHGCQCCCLHKYLFDIQLCHPRRDSIGDHSPLKCQQLWNRCLSLYPFTHETLLAAYLLCRRWIEHELSCPYICLGQRWIPSWACLVDCDSRHGHLWNRRLLFLLHGLLVLHLCCYNDHDHPTGEKNWIYYIAFNIHVGLLFQTWFLNKCRLLATLFQTSLYSAGLPFDMCFYDVEKRSSLVLQSKFPSGTKNETQEKPVHHKHTARSSERFQWLLNRSYQECL